METEESIRLVQMMRLVHWLQENAYNYTSSFIYDTSNDIVVVNIKNGDQNIIYRGKVESFSKKGAIKNKEMDRMIVNLLEIKDDLELKNTSIK